ncbi:MAG: hypothetical protein HKM02_06090 [Pseudomonadales bacterium]|nr:hypothetical protein [Pseudomonadales bacterium]
MPQLVGMINAHSLLPCLPILLSVVSGVALRFMLLYPGQPTRLWPWLGFIPAQAQRYASRLWQTVFPGASSTDVWLERMQPEHMAKHLSRLAAQRMPWIMDQCFSGEDAVRWENVPPWVKEQIYRHGQHELDRWFDDWVEDVLRQSRAWLDFQPWMAQSMLRSGQLVSCYAALLPLTPRVLGVWGLGGFLCGIPGWIPGGMSSMHLFLEMLLALSWPWWLASWAWRWEPSAELPAKGWSAWLLQEVLDTRKIMGALFLSHEEGMERILVQHLDRLLSPDVFTRLFKRWLGHAAWVRLQCRARALARPMLLSGLAEPTWKRESAEYLAPYVKDSLSAEHVSALRELRAWLLASPHGLWGLPWAILLAMIFSQLTHFVS